MPTIDVYNMEGKVCGTLELSDKVFAAQVNGPVIHSVVRAYLLNQRQGTQSTLTRSEVAGGGRKPWRQKGTGRARQGSTRAPQWTKGGIALGPKPRSYRVSVNKKEKRIAMLGALSSKVSSGEVRLVRLDCKATIGQVGNLEHENIKLGKAGKTRHLGIRPTVRGSVMNPVDHPHGGGEGRSPIGRPSPVTPWGKPTLGYKTRNKKARTDKFIVKRRNDK